MKFFFIFIYLLLWVFVVALRLSLVVASGGYSLVAVVLGLLIPVACLAVEHELYGAEALAVVAKEHRLSSCGQWAQLLCSMWNLLGPGIEAMSPGLAGRFLTTESPGKP